MLSRIPLRWPEASLRRAATAWPWLLAIAVGVLVFLDSPGLVRVATDPFGTQGAPVATFATEVERVTDGVVASSGSAWNCGAASIISSGGSIEWDLGRVVPVERAFVQADNDDRYVLVVSNDRKHWAELWEAGPLQETGLGSRHVEGLNGQARYVRLEPRGGDGSYSVAELRLASDRAGPWPPVLAERDQTQPEVRGQSERERMLGWAILLGSGTILFAWLLRRRSAESFFRQPIAAITLVLSLFVLGTALGYAVKHRFNLVDDTYISLQYAKNWASGQGLVFNPGERVEGYTNFLWTLLLTPLWPLSGHDPVWMTRLSTWLALGLTIAGLWLVAAVGRQVFPKAPVAQAFAVLLVAFDDSIISYPVVFALENQLLIALMLGGLALFLYRPLGWELALGATFALVGMTRFDGLLWGSTFFVAHAAPSFLRPTEEPRLQGRSLLLISGAFLGVFGAYFAARTLYYGELLPNTFHLKVGSTLDALPRGFEYGRSYFAARFGVPLLGLVAILMTRAGWVRWLLLHAVLHLTYITYVGGDFYAGHRFLLALTPSFSILSAVVLTRLLKGSIGLWKRRFALLGAIAAAVAVRWGTLQDGPFKHDLYGWSPVVDNNVQYMRWLKDRARPGSSMVVGDIGATGLFANVSVIDFFGVVDLAVARKRVERFGTGKAGHEKVLTREEQLARQPTYIKWGYVDDSRRPPGYYIFNDFPRHLRVEGLWVRDDLAKGRALPDSGWGFSHEELRTWARSGTAFEAAPSSDPIPGQTPITGHFGPLINTFSRTLGDQALGTLRSPPFLLTGDRMRLLVGGGRDPERLRVSLLVDDRRVFSETGTNWETLGRREWDIGPLRGKSARIEIIDQASGAWGHLLVDEIEQWVGTPNSTGKL